MEVSEGKGRGVEKELREEQGRVEVSEGRGRGLRRS